MFKPAALMALAALAAMPAAAADLDIPFTRFQLDNGLTVIVHEDHKAPIVAVNVWYHVGSKNEVEGKTGFAHLFEHLMFNGSENYDDDWFKAMDKIGATDLNGTTNFDRTNYFQNVPVTAIDTALWLESDRMGHLLGAINQEKLDEQRGVVQNEKRQGENQPYGEAYNLIFKNTYPKGHPYSWPIIGYMEDLDAASLDDVNGWFETYYGAANAVIVVAGDVEPDDVRQRMEKYFGDIESGPPVKKYKAWVAKRTGQTRQVIQDRVPQARVYKTWNMPEFVHPDTDYLDLVSDVLTDGKNSRLYKRLVYDEQIATDVTSFAFGRELGGLFVIYATAHPDADLDEVERAIDEELARFLENGPSKSELERVKTGNRAAFIRGSERIGGFGGKSDILAWGEVYYDDPAAYKTVRERIANASVRDVQRAARNWLNDGEYVLEIHPFPTYAAKPQGVDRSELPLPADFPNGKFPKLERATLSNGLKVVLAKHEAIPVIDFDLMIDAGYAADQFADPGTASLAMAMLDEGTRNRSALEISDELDRLGASLGAGSNLDVSTVGLSALEENLDDSLEIFADVVLNPSFPKADFERLKKQQLVAIQREKVTPFSMALRVFPKLLYGADHAYGNPLTGSGTEESVSNMTRADLRDFHETWFKPNNATLVVVGNTTLEQITPKLEKLFKGWRAGDVPAKNLSQVAQKAASTVFIVDRPDSQQSIIFAGHVVAPKNNPDEIAIEAMNNVLGGSFTARINMNLREDKGWAYGARSAIVDALGQRPFLAYAPVQSDKTKESMAEILAEISDIRSERPPESGEIDNVKDRNILSLPGRWETGGAISGSIAEIVRFGLDDTYWDGYADSLRALNENSVREAAVNSLNPDKLVWVVVGDRKTIEEGIRDLDIGEIRYADADGSVIEGAPPGSASR